MRAAHDSADFLLEGWKLLIQRSPGLQIQFFLPSRLYWSIRITVVGKFRLCISPGSEKRPALRSGNFRLTRRNRRESQNSELQEPQTRFRTATPLLCCAGRLALLCALPRETLQARAALDDLLSRSTSKAFPA